MSEFKYACPVCGQHIRCDSSQSGSMMECPTCFQKITVPQAPTTDEQKFIITGTKKGERPVPATPEGSSNPTPTTKGFSGAVVEGLSSQFGLMSAYAVFFLGCGAIAVPSLALFWLLSARQKPG